MKTVGISDFVRNQIKKSGKSEIINISLEKVKFKMPKQENFLFSHTL